MNMTPTELVDSSKAKRRKSPSAPWLFFLRWLANPLTMGSVTPSSNALKKLIQQHLVCDEDEVVVEFGGGTGPITQAILDAGVPGNKLYVFEIDPELADYLREHFPGVNLVHGDCRHVGKLIDATHVGKVGTVVVGIPMVTLPVALQRDIVEALFSVMPKGRRFLLYTYCTTSPLNMKALGLKGKRLGWTPKNFPPASVWAYQKVE
ncbi:MAG TPA: phospholipid methyltransferase [Azospirillaceae bacterium]|nr:phospholipid methyltransferase [Azospirillaceae bacterium]